MRFIANKLLCFAGILGSALPYFDFFQDQGTASSQAFALAAGPGIVVTMARLFLIGETNGPFLRWVARLGFFAAVLVILSAAGAVAMAVTGWHLKNPWLVGGCLPFSFLLGGLTLRQTYNFLRLKPGECADGFSGRAQPKPSLADIFADAEFGGETPKKPWFLSDENLANLIGFSFAGLTIFLLAAKPSLRSDPMLISAGGLFVFGAIFVVLKKMRDQIAQAAFGGESFRRKDGLADAIGKLVRLGSGATGLWILFLAAFSDNPVALASMKKNPVMPYIAGVILFFGAVALVLIRKIASARGAGKYSATLNGLVETHRFGETRVRWKDIDAMDLTPLASGMTLRVALVDAECLLAIEGLKQGTSDATIEEWRQTRREFTLRNRRLASGDLLLGQHSITGSFGEFLAMVRAHGVEAAVMQQG